jgi:hypothetical protein
MIREASPASGNAAMVELNWTFGAHRADSTVRNRSDLDQSFYYRSDAKIK